MVNMVTLSQTNTEEITVSEPVNTSNYITAYGVQYPVEFISASEAKTIPTYTSADHKFILTISSGQYAGTYTGTANADPFVLYNGYLYYLGAYAPVDNGNINARTVSTVPF